MRTRILTLTALILALESTVAGAQPHAPPLKLKPASAALVVDPLLAGRETSALSADQAGRLTLLSTRLHHDHRHPVVAGLDRVLGKSVPRIDRIQIAATEAFRLASAVVTPEQQAEAARLLEGPHG